MARRKRTAPSELPIVVVAWHDAMIVQSSALSIELPVQITTGFLVHDDETLIVLVHGFLPETDWFFGADDNTDYHKIPKGLILSMKTVGTHSLKDGDA